MATLPRLRVGLTLDSATFVRETNRVIDSINNMSARMQRQNRDMARSFQSVERGVGQVVGGLRTLGALVGIGSFAALAQQAIRTADAFTEMAGRLKLVTDNSKEAAAVQQRLIQIATQNRATIADTATLYTRLALTLRDAGVQSEALLDVTQIVGQAVKIGGSNAVEASAGILQFAQAMGSGVLQGEELRAVLEQVPGLAKAIADGLGVPIGQLKQLGQAGELTTQRVLNALLKQAPEIERQFGSLPITVGDAMVQLGNSITGLVGAADQAEGSSRSLAGAISELAETISSDEFVTGFRQFIGEFLTEAEQRLRTTREEWERLVSAFKAGQDFLAGFGLATPQSLEAISDRIAQINEELAESIRLGEQMQAGPALAVNTAKIDALRQEREELVKRRNDLQFGTVETERAAEAEQKLASAIKTTGITIKGQSGATKEQIADAARLAKQRAETLADLNAESAGLKLLATAQGQGVDAIRQAEAAIDAFNALRKLKLADDSEEAQRITELITKNTQLATALDVAKEAQGQAQQQAALRAEIQAGGRQTTELRSQIELLKIKGKLGDQAAASLEEEVRLTQALVSESESVNVARDLSDTIAQQRLLLQYGGEETEQYRIQLRLLQLKQAGIENITPELRAQVEELERQQTQLDSISKTQDTLAEGLQDSFENAMENIQNLTTETFETIYRGGIKTFGDLADAIKDIFIRLAAEISTLMVFRAATASTAGLVGAGGSLAQMFGFAGPAAAGGVTPITNAPGAAPLAGLTVGAGLSAPAAFRGAAATTPWWLTPQTGIAPLLLSGALGFAGGGLLGGLTGSRTGGGILGGIGAAGGTALFGPLGGLLGGAGGGLLGGFFGSLLGGGPSGNEVSLSGGLGRAGAGGTGAAAKFVQDFDKKMSALLNRRQLKLADEALREANATTVKYEKELSEGDIARLAEGRIAPVARALGFRTQAFRGLGAEEGLAQLAEALQLERTIEDLTGAVTPFQRAMQDLRSEFDETEARAKELGISTKGMGAALREAQDELRAQRLLERDTLRLELQQFIGGDSPAQALKVALAGIDLQFESLKKRAEELGISLELVNKAETAARNQAREAARQAAQQQAVDRANLQLQLQATIATGSGNELAVALARIDLEFKAIKKSAIELGVSLVLVQEAETAARNAAKQAARDAARAEQEAEQARRTGAVLTFRELTSTLSPLEAEIEAVNQRFREFRPIAKEYGLSIAALNAAQLRITRALAAAAREAALANFQQLTGDEFSNEIDRINDTYREARIEAKKYGLSIAELNKAQLEATRAVDRRRRAERDALALSVVNPFQNLLAPLDDLTRELEQTLLNPASLFARAQQDFRDIAKRAEAGDVGAIEGFDEAARFFIDQAGRFGASPAQAEAIREVSAATERVKNEVRDAQREASKGITDAINRADRNNIDTLRELIKVGQDTAAEVQKLGRQLTQATKK